MSLAHTLDVPSPSSPSGSTARSGDRIRAVLFAAIGALTIALLGGAYAYLGGAADGYPDPTQQWTD